METIKVATRQRDDLADITEQVRSAVRSSGVEDGLAIVYVPHTTAGVTINESADADVPRDLLRQLDEMVPWSQPFYRHAEGNSAAHVKASLMGSSASVIVRGGQLVLGTWQGIFLCEFDGPRERKVIITIVKA
jgi:secondary thiamine-phosphate synthase enzyme